MNTLLLLCLAFSSALAEVRLSHTYARRTEDMSHTVSSSTRLRRICTSGCYVDKLWFPDSNQKQRCFYVVRQKTSEHPSNVFDANCDNNNIDTAPISRHSYGDVITVNHGRSIDGYGSSYGHERRYEHTYGSHGSHRHGSSYDDDNRESYVVPNYRQSVAAAGFSLALLILGTLL